MRILCCVNADVVSSYALNLLLPTLASHEVCVGLSTRIGARVRDANEPAPRRELRAAEQGFAELVFPLIERSELPDDGRFLTFGELERHRGIRVTALPNPNIGDGLAFITSFAPDVIVSIRYGAIFKAPAIAVPRFGILNLHAGVLPAYRGVLATFRALMAAEREIGSTLHFITDGTIDTGPVIDQARVAVDPERSLFWHVAALYPSGIALMARTIQELVRGESITTHVQAGGNYFTYPTAEEWAAFLLRGWRVVDPTDLHDMFARYTR